MRLRAIAIKGDLPGLRQALCEKIALAWVLRHLGVIAIPKASNEEHVRANARAIDIELTKKDLAALDRELPPPQTKQPLLTL
jgi:diketogulonate reductase-like aldo/keto reductase